MPLLWLSTLAGAGGQSVAEGAEPDVDDAQSPESVVTIKSLWLDIIQNQAGGQEHRDPQHHAACGPGSGEGAFRAVVP